MWPPETSFPKTLLEFKSPTPTCSMCLALANCATSPKSFQGKKKHPPERAKKNCHASVHTWEATGCVRTEERPRAVSRSRSWPHVRCLDSCREFAACSFRRTEEARTISSIALYSIGLHQGASQSNTGSDYPWPPDSDLSRLPRYQSLFWYEASQKMICAAHLGHLEGAARKHGRGLGWVGRAQI